MRRFFVKIEEYGISSADFHAEFSAQKRNFAVLAFTTHRVARSMVNAPPPGLLVNLRCLLSGQQTLGGGGFNFQKKIHINLQAYLGKMIHFDFFAYFSFMGWWVQPPKACFQPGSWSHAPFAKTKQGSYDRCGGQAFNCRQGNLDVFGNPSFFLGFTILFYPRTYGSSGKLTLKWKVTILLEIKKPTFN